MNRYLKVGSPLAAILGTLALGTLAWLGLRPTQESHPYFKTVPEVKHMGEQARGLRLRVTGWVKEGSIQRAGSHTVFLLVDTKGDRDNASGDDLTVAYKGNEPLPLAFTDGSQTLADGKLGADGVFQAEKIQAKCGKFGDEFDINQPVTFHGEVTQVEWSNPHVRIHLMVHNDAQRQEGEMVNWIVEGGSPNALFRNGLTRNSLPEGTTIAVDGYRAWHGANLAIGGDVTLPGGKKFLLGSCGLESPNS